MPLVLRHARTEDSTEYDLCLVQVLGRCSVFVVTETVDDEWLFLSRLLYNPTTDGRMPFTAALFETARRTTVSPHRSNNAIRIDEIDSRHIYH